MRIRAHTVQVLTSGELVQIGDSQDIWTFDGLPIAVQGS